MEAVLADEADLGIMSYPLADRSLTVVPLQDEPMGFVCHPSHRLARRRLVMPADLAGEPFVAFDAGLTIRKAIDRALRQANVRLNIVMEFDNIETIKQAISIAAGVSILSPPHGGEGGEHRDARGPSWRADSTASGADPGVSFCV